MASTYAMMSSSCMVSFLSRWFSILAFLLDSASDSLVALAKATTSFLLMGGEVGLGASYGGRTMEGEG
ncbi:hypothetical protein GYH30_000807 [Glycine max]|nr:hypothetical protein GYH30_000807 [Glycine max]